MTPVAPALLLLAALAAAPVAVRSAPLEAVVLSSEKVQRASCQEPAHTAATAPPQEQEPPRDSWLSAPVLLGAATGASLCSGVVYSAMGAPAAQAAAGLSCALMGGWAAKRLEQVGQPPARKPFAFAEHRPAPERKCESRTAYRTTVRLKDGRLAAFESGDEFRPGQPVRVQVD